jgi:uncharacterized protein
MRSNLDSQPKQRRGFAVMDRSRQREIASLGGRAAHQSGRAHEFTSEEARQAGVRRQQVRRAQVGPQAATTPVADETVAT